MMTVDQLADGFTGHPRHRPAYRAGLVQLKTLVEGLADDEVAELYGGLRGTQKTLEMAIAKATVITSMIAVRGMGPDIDIQIERAKAIVDDPKTSPSQARLIQVAATHFWTALTEYDVATEPARLNGGLMGPRKALRAIARYTLTYQQLLVALESTRTIPNDRES